MKAIQPSQDIKRVMIGATLVALPVLVFLFWLIYFKNPAPAAGTWVAYLPFTNAVLNTITSVLLCTGYWLIKRGMREAHKKVMLAAVATSALFLVSYLTYHHFQGDTKFMGTGFIRPVYFFILISHIILSIVQVPLILATLWASYKVNWSMHRKFARVTFPIWLYVSVTGVLIFIFLNVF